MRSDIQPGAEFPDYELPDHDGVERRLSEMQGRIPMVLHLSRGGYCPREQRFVRNLVDAYPEFRVAYTRIVLISTDDQLNTAEFRDGIAAEFPFLVDPGRIVQQDLEIQEFTDPVHDPMVPHTFVLAPGLKIFSMYNGYWYWGRPSMHELRVDLRNLWMEHRPDFDITTPGLREAWERGEKGMFLVEPPVGEAIRYTEGAGVGVKR